MSVYVDDMHAPYGRLIMCHMLADTDAELHAMADRIGVARKWHQGDHYDIALSKRRLAIKFGAVEITALAAGIMAMHRRRAGSMPSLADVPALMARLKAAVRERYIANSEMWPDNNSNSQIGGYRSTS